MSHSGKGAALRPAAAFVQGEQGSQALRSGAAALPRQGSRARKRVNANRFRRKP